ncbi:hypothetical protein GYA49_06035 [Candidatus Beckwithbacteria bacterium]|nr:hypothetical protein [Candidatus Beckwithbacteria bacterium]
MTSTANLPIKASTQDHLDIEDIQDDVVILKTGACALILQVTAINFGLLSEEEQDAIIFAYAGLLNSLTFPIQILIRSTIKDITDYLHLIKEQEFKQKKPLLLEQLKKYRSFVESIVKENQVLDKKFYAVIPFTTLELGLVNTLGSSFQKTKKLPYPKNYILERAKMNLYPKRDHLFRQFARLGLQAKQLNTQQILELFYNLYNQENVGQHFVDTKNYQIPIVQTDPSKQNPTSLGGPTFSPTSSSMPTTPFPRSNKAIETTEPKQSMQTTQNAALKPVVNPTHFQPQTPKSTINRSEVQNPSQHPALTTPPSSPNPPSTPIEATDKNVSGFNYDSSEI